MNLIKQFLIVTIVSLVTLKFSDIAGYFQSQTVSSGLAKGTERAIVMRELNPNQTALFDLTII